MAFAPLHRLARIIGLGIVVATLGTCDRQGAPVADPPSASEVTTHETRPATLRGWHYRVTPDPRLESAAVEVYFVGDAPPMLTLGADEALPHIHDVRRADATPYVATATGYRLESMPADGCLTYTVDFNGLEADQGVGRGVGRTGNSLMLRASAWLLRPAQRPSEADVTLRLSLPEGMSAALPWATRGDGPRGTSQATYVVPDTSFYWTSIAVLGDLAIDRFEHAGTSVELVRLDAEIACTPDGLRSWVIDAIDTVAMLFEGRFPRQRLQLMVLPTEGGGNQSVYFGMATRGGGPGVLIFLDDQAKAEALPGGWTTVHELLHHGMPFIDDSWMAEGWVSYYTELMRTRMGHRTEVEGWQALHER
ncbi:MAG: hypothetical protein K0V04_30645 [Deltaproteobacteria bacterium]|nr:hypothetical protein [Deltaproteobacteria bacterium]